MGGVLWSPIRVADLRRLCDEYTVVLGNGRLRVKRLRIVVISRWGRFCGVTDDASMFQPSVQVVVASGECSDFAAGAWIWRIDEVLVRRSFGGWYGCCRC